MATKKELRLKFNEEIAPKLAEQVGATERVPPKALSKRFAYFRGSDGEFVIVAGDQEEEKVDLALAFGLTYRKDRPLVLVLPKDRSFPTLQRRPWLAKSAQPGVYLHDAVDVGREEPLRSTEETKTVAARVTNKAPAVEFRQATTPLYLNDLPADVIDLVEWATKDRRLDAGHRQGERSWHCMGQKVLSIRRSGKKFMLRGGIHTTKTGQPAFEDDEGTAPEAPNADVAIERAREGIAERLTGKRCKPDEHWLQAVIRRDPSLVGVEQPALREVPAWRPTAKAAPTGHQFAWGRGFIDLAGLDGHGDLRIVETKLAKNQDELLFLQGLDYYIWACAYEDPLKARLGAAPHAKIEVHYVIGEDPKTKSVKVSRFAAAIADALEIPWRIQTVCDWHHGPEEHSRARSELLPTGELPR